MRQTLKRNSWWQIIVITWIAIVSCQPIPAEVPAFMRMLWTRCGDPVAHRGAGFASRYFDLSGGIAGMIARFGRSAGFRRNANGYLSGSVFSSGSVERHAYRHVVQAKTVHTPATGELLRTSIFAARHRGQTFGSTPEVELVISPSP
jgi:hypothetical protein